MAAAAYLRLAGHNKHAGLVRRGVARCGVAGVDAEEAVVELPVVARQHLGVGAEQPGVGDQALHLMLGQLGGEGVSWVHVAARGEAGWAGVQHVAGVCIDHQPPGTGR